MRTKLTRRTLLRGMLAGSTVAVGLPMLEMFVDGRGAALANGDAFPPRFGLFFWGNGVIPDKWNPTGTGAGDAWQLSEQLAPLADLKDLVTVVSGTEVKTANKIPHTSGAAGILSGAELLIEGEDIETFASPSIDQIIAADIGDQTRFGSLEFGARPRAGLSYNGPNNKNPFESSPYLFFERVFGAGFRAPGETTEVDPSLGLRRSVLDAITDDIADARKGVGAVDSARLDQHFEGIRALELRLARLEEDPPQRAACARPDAPLESYPDVDGRPQIKEINRAMCDTLAMALACDQTRVFSNVITFPVSNELFVGASAGHHRLTHDEPGDQPQVNQIVISLIEEYAYLLSALRAIPEGEGTLLDNCVVLGTTDVAYGRTHTLSDFPLVYGGSAGGRLRTGMHYRSEVRENSSTFMLSLIRAAGVRAESFGLGEGRVTDGLSEIEV